MISPASRVYGLRPPERTIELDVKKIDLLPTVKDCYLAWLDATVGLREREHEEYKETGDQQYDVACKIVRPFGERLRGRIHTDDMPFLAEGEPEKPQAHSDSCVGSFLSALLNETGVSSVTVGPFPYCLLSVGSHLKPGKTVVIEKNVEVYRVADNATGGTAINHGEIQYLGFEAEGGNIFNYGDCGGEFGYGSVGGNRFNFGRAQNMGHRCRGGNWFNHSRVSNRFCEEADGGLFVNFESWPWDMRYGEWSKNCVLIQTTKETKNFAEHMKETKYKIREAEGYGRLWFIRERKIRKDARLKSLLRGLELASEKQNVPRVEELARLIDGRVRRKYNTTKTWEHSSR